MASNGDQTRASGSEFTTKPLFMVCSRAQPLFFKRTPDSRAAAAIFKKNASSRCDVPPRNHRVNTQVTRRHQQWQQPQDCPLLIERVDDVQETPNDFTSFQRQGLRQLQQNASRTQLGQPYPLPDPQNARFPPWFASLPSHDVLDVDQYHAPWRHPHKCKETRALEREERRRRTDQEDWRRRTQAKFMRQLLAHREDVMKRGRATRADAARCARGCKQKLAQEERGREAEETRTARKRLQALRAHDMASYAKRVLGVPRCCGAFTPSMRLVFIRRGRGWFLFGF